MSIYTKKIVLFICLVTLFSLPIYIAVTGFKAEHSFLAILLMWTPALSAIITKLLFDKNLSGMGWTAGKLLYLPLSFFIPILSCIVLYTFVWWTGLGGLDPAILFDGKSIPSFSLNMLVFLLISVFLAAGEEIGWRGFLVPELLKKFSYIKASLLIAIIWNLYHYPLILFSDYNNGTSKLLSLVFFSITVTSVCFITTYIRSKSGSLWTGVIFHASHNFFVQVIFDPLTVDYGRTKLYTTEFGIGLALIYSLAALYCITNKRKLNLQHYSLKTCNEPKMTD